MTSDNYERLGLLKRDFEVKLSRRAWNRVPDSIEDALDSIEPEMLFVFFFTRFAVSFLAACQGPQPTPNGAGSTKRLTGSDRDGEEASRHRD